ncbi:hypothetical protein AB4Z54_14115, partial [Streptomyces sp. MCAF7]
AEASADLAPFAEGLKKGDKLPLKLTFGEGGKITAPSGATELDIKELMEAAGAMMLGGVDGADADDAISGDDFIVDDDVQGPEDINGIDGLTIDLDDLEKADARNR